MRQQAGPGNTGGGASGRCTEERRGRIAAPNLRGVFVAVTHRGPGGPGQAPIAMKYRGTRGAICLGIRLAIEADTRMGARRSSRASLKRVRASKPRASSRAASKNGDIDRASLHGNAPDHSKVAVLLVDVINDMEFPGGDVLAARARPVASTVAATRIGERFELGQRHPRSGGRRLTRRELSRRNAAARSAAFPASTRHLR